MTKYEARTSETGMLAGWTKEDMRIINDLIMKPCSIYGYGGEEYSAESLSQAFVRDEAFKTSPKP